MIKSIKIIIPIVLIISLCLAQSGRVTIGGRVTSIGGPITSSGGIVVSTITTTNTQALIPYVAPSGSACSMEISESASYTPLVHDVDTTLYTNANLDSRASGVSSGTSRWFVAGSRLVATALDSFKYSRALQTNTLHYYRITCGASTATDTFTTANIPVGMTFIESPTVDTVVAGDWLLPTRGVITANRTEVIIDPYTGASLSPVSLQGDQQPGSTGMTINDGARVHNFVTPTSTDGSGNVGYIVNLSARNGFNLPYFVIPATGEARNLGRVPLSPYIDMNHLLQLFSYSSPNTTQYNYLGAYAGLAPGGSASLSGGTVVSSTSIEQLINNYDATFDVTKYGCDKVWPLTGTYGGTACYRGAPSSPQDSYGWFAIMDGTTKTIVAAWNSYIAQPSKFCGIHSWNTNAPINLLAANWHGLGTNNYPGTDTTIGTASIVTTTSVGSSIGTNTITVTGPPASMAVGDTVTAPTVTAGDRVNVSGNKMQLSINPVGNVYTFTSNLTSTVASGDQVQMACNSPQGIGGTAWSYIYWDFINDPHGTDITNTYVITDTQFPGGGHDDTGPLGRVAEWTTGWALFKVVSTFLVSINTAGIVVSSAASYNGITPPGDGNLLVKHPSYQQTTNDPWFMDRVIFAGGVPYSASLGATSVSGSLWKYISDGSNLLHRKLVSTQASNGIHGLRDISSSTTGNVIGTGSGDNYTYCVAHKVNECRTGSVAGDIFFNVPTLTYAYCPGGDSPDPSKLGICITDTPPYSGTLMQLYLGTSNADVWSKSRNITGGLVGPGDVYNFPLAKTSPDTSYALFTIGSDFDGAIDTWKVKLPTYPSTDGVDRTNFISTPITVGAGVQNNVVVKFWYGEYGTNNNCGTRNENCYATAATIPGGANPYLYPSDGSAGTLVTVTGLACAGGCSVAVPATSGKMLYYQIIYRDVANAILSSSVVGIIAIQ